MGLSPSIQVVTGWNVMAGAWKKAHSNQFFYATGAVSRSRRCLHNLYAGSFTIRAKEPRQ